MGDVLVIAAVVIFFLLSAAYTRGCDRL